MNKWTCICKSCVFVLPGSVCRRLNRASHVSPTHTHTLRHHLRYTCPTLCCVHASSFNHFPLTPPRPPFHLKGLWSRCITLNRSKRSREGAGRSYRCSASGRRTNRDDSDNGPDDKKMMTHKNAVYKRIQSIWPQLTARESKTRLPNVTTRAVCVLLSVNHSFPLICEWAVVWGV